MSDYPNTPEGKRAKPAKTGGAIWKVLVVCAALAAAVGGWMVYQDILAQQALPPEPITFSYRDLTLQAKEGVPVNTLGKDNFFQDEQGRTQYEQGTQRARQGIDVSFYQGEIDWLAVAQDGVEFAIIRLGYRGYTEGGLRMDSRFEENIQGALAVGIEVVVYFFSQAITPQEAREEAQFVLQAIEGYDVSSPVVFDWEVITPGNDARTDGLDGQTLTQCALAFCQEIERAGYTPLVYFNQDLAYLTYDLSQMTQYSFWLAEYNPVPNFYYSFDLWQYTHTGTVAGIEGSVDWNLDLRPIQ